MKAAEIDEGKERRVLNEQLAPMTPIERVRCELAMADAGYKWEPSIEDIAALLSAYDDERDDARRLHRNSVDRWMALQFIASHESDGAAALVAYATAAMGGATLEDAP